MVTHVELPEPDGSLHNARPRPTGTGRGRRVNQLAALERYGLTPGSQILEIGCGVGWLAYDLASRLDETGTYVGVDVSKAAIAWLNTNYAARLPNYRFDLFNVRNARYRPHALRRPEHVRFPYHDRQFDLVCAFNVFVYMTAPAIATYLREIARVLRPDGIAILTFKAVFDRDTGPRVGELAYVNVGPGTYTRKPEHHGWAMAFDDTLIRSMLETAGLDVRAFERGTWHDPASIATSAPGRPGPDLYAATPRHRPE